MDHDQQHHKLHALRLQVEAALAQVQDHLQQLEHDRNQQHEAGFVDLSEPLHQVHQHLQESDRLLEQHDHDHDHDEQHDHDHDHDQQQ